MTEIVRATDTIIAEDFDLSQEEEKNLKQNSIFSRVELNLEKFSIWSTKPKHGTVFVESKVIEHEPERLPDGNLVQRRIEIVPTAKYGYPTIQTRMYWHALQKLWHESEFPNKEKGIVEFSRRQILVDVLGLTYSKTTRKALDLSLNQMHSTQLAFDYLFYDKARNETYRELEKFHILTKLNLTRRKRADEVIHEKCSVTFDPLITSNLLSGYYKPVLSVFSEIKSEIGQLLYQKLDLQFSHYTRYEISTERFFRENGVVGKEYKHPSGRKRKLEKAIKELIGKSTSSGAVIAKYEFVKTADGKDWKLIVRSKGKRNRGIQTEVIESLQRAESEPKKRKPKRKTSQKPQEPHHEAKEPQPRETPTPTPKKPTEAKSDACKVLELFDKIFDGGGRHSESDVVKAEAIIKEHGLQVAEYLVRFAGNEAPKTNYKPKFFSGIVKYKAAALKEWKSTQKRQERQAQKIAETRLKNARYDHEKAYRGDYYEYVDELVCSLGDEYPSRFNEFRCWQAEQRREKENLEGNLREVSLRVFDSEGQSILRLTQFFQDDPDIHIPDFWEWDCQDNPHRFTTEGD